MKALVRQSSGQWQGIFFKATPRQGRWSGPVHFCAGRKLFTFTRNMKFVESKRQLAMACGISRPTLDRMIRLYEHPGLTPSGRYNVEQWRLFIRTHFCGWSFENSMKRWRKNER